MFSWKAAPARRAMVRTLAVSRSPLFFFMSVNRPLRRRPEEIPVRPAEPRPDHGEHGEAAQETGEQRESSGAGRVVAADGPYRPGGVEDSQDRPGVDGRDQDLGRSRPPLPDPAEADGGRLHG